MARLMPDEELTQLILWARSVTSGGEAVWELLEGWVPGRGDWPDILPGSGHHDPPKARHW